MNQREGSRVGLTWRVNQKANLPRRASGSEEYRLDGCAYPGAAVTRGIGALADQTWVSVCGSRRW